MDLSQLFDDLKAFKKPPVDQWHPDTIVDFDLHIDQHGRWYHEGTEFRRKRLAKLFATVLRYQDGDYFLVTPPTKYRIRVDDVPFIITSMAVESPGTETQCIHLRSNMDEVVTVDTAHPVMMRIPPKVDSDSTIHPIPYIEVRDGLLARFNRASNYEFASYLKHVDDDYVLVSSGQTFTLSF